jgi:hypothetical protein
VLAQLGDQLRPDQPRPTDHNDLHDISLRSTNAITVPTAAGGSKARTRRPADL